jgi:hypothetical protein
LNNITGGNYELTVTDASNCKVTYQANVQNVGLNINVVYKYDDYCGFGYGSVEFNVTGGDGFYTYTLNGLPDDFGGWPYWYNLTAGNYLFEVYDGAGCYASRWVTINNSAFDITISNAIVTNDNCLQGAGSIDITVTGNYPPFTYNWSNGQNSQDINNLLMNTYTVTITDDIDCKLTQSYQVFNNSDIDIYLFPVNETCGEGNGSITSLIVGGQTPYTYNWSNGLQTSGLSNLHSGNYTLTLTDNSGCLVIKSVSINNISGGFDVTANLIHERCGNGQGEINLNVFGGESPYSYNWNTGEVTSSINSLTAGNYQVTITDDAGCRLFKNYQINNQNILITNTFIGDDYCGQGYGSVQFNISGGDGNYTFLLNGQSEPLIGTPYWFNLTAGNYLFEANDGSGCYISTNVTIGNFTNGLTVNSTVVNTTCGRSSGSIVLSTTSGVPPYTYNWSNGFIVNEMYMMSPGIYTVTVTDSDFCSVIQTFDVYSPLLIASTSVTSASNEITADGTAGVNIIQSTGAISYLWSNGAVTQNISGLLTGDYFVTVSDTYGCDTILKATVPFTTGIDEYQGDMFNVTIYPNPAKEVLFINAYKEMDKYEIYDVSGRLINAKGSINSITESIEITQMESGVYMIKIYAGESYVVKRFSKI